MIFLSLKQDCQQSRHYYDGLTREQMDRHMKIIADAVQYVRQTQQKLTEKIMILDAGCGNGNQDHALSLRFNAAVTGITPFDGEYDACMEKKKDAAKLGKDNPYKDVAFFKAGMPDLGGVNGKFDVVYSDCAFQYMKGDDRAATLTRFSETLNNGGVIALRYPDRPTFSSDSSHPSLEEFREEINSFNDAASFFRLNIISLKETGDTLVEKRPEKNIHMIETILRPVSLK
ncbi:MAG: hypothetical protein CO093_04185 [Alphaproteobacteria bacterium CG_4_9_14_3_um_filter_47_13]|nr:MAG: hypothetical protein CO093_04185 [Alphaproteobacteria bacterium CG_4_9_14_3_um_filter_47_13]